jgi:hypothetical protein
MAPLRKGDRGDLVERWQEFLLGQGFDPEGTDGVFGDDTEAATLAFQRAAGVPASGIVDAATLAAARARGAAPEAADAGDDFPPRPPFPPLLGNDARAALFGRFAFVAAPLPGNKENIRITDGWEQAEIVTVSLPQLRPLTGRDTVRFHRKAAGQMRALWADWERAGLLKHVTSWGGTFVPRFIRGSTTTLSNHAFGTAFDINMKENALGAVPAMRGQPGCVRDLVAAAHASGFYWGGHFKRRDGMHFEIAVVQG